MDRGGRCDLAIVGGGLAGGLLAYALTIKQPHLKIRLIEPGGRFGGNHIWSFFSNDIAPEHRWIIEPFIDHSWNGYEVRFPKLRRALGVQYNSVRSSAFDGRLRTLLPESVPMSATAAHVGPTTVALGNQRMLHARAVIDARGAAQTRFLDVGWQKFLGQEIRTTHPHGLTNPILMDANVPQYDGFRFVYVLPFTERRLFIEDTYYSSTPGIIRDTLSHRIADYAESQNWTIKEVVSEETGALPVTMGGNFPAYWDSGGEAAKIGMRAGLFHPATGYSLPDAVRTAAMIAGMPHLGGTLLAAKLFQYAADQWRGRGFYRMLDRMVFQAAEPAERYKIYQRFYRLSPDLISRFYAGTSTTLDKARILAGRPPVPIGKAIRVIQEN